MGAIRHLGLTGRACPEGGGSRRYRLGIVGLVLFSVLGWSLVATASSRAAGPPAIIGVTVTPSSIPLNGVSTATATATVLDSLGRPVSGETVTISAGNIFVGVGPTSPGPLAGTYTATITSASPLLASPGPVTITATDSAAGLSGQTTLIQTGPASAISTPILSPTLLTADGSSSTVATVTVTDSAGDPVPGEPVVFSTSPSGHAVSATSPGPLPGTYTATITSTTALGQVIVTAKDGALSSPGAILTQTVGPAANVSLSLQPTSIPADGSSSTTATATVTDSAGHPILDDNVVFFVSDPGTTVGATANHQNGTYSATITSSTTPGPVTIVAVDVTPSGRPNGQATLTQTPGPSTTTLSVVPSQPVTNQAVTLVATVTSALGPSGTVVFQNGGTTISGCGSVSVAPATAGGTTGTAHCKASFAAASPPTLTAVYMPSGGNLAGSTSAPDQLAVGQDSTSVSLTSSATTPTVGHSVTFTAAVDTNHGGSTQPTGQVEFFDGNHILSGCGSQPVIKVKDDAVCQVTFGASGPRVISARYGGDGSFTGSSSPLLVAVVRSKSAPQPLLATLAWEFAFHPSYTTVPILQAHSVPAGASVQFTCAGKGCPSTKGTIAVSNSKSCKITSTRQCIKSGSATVALTPAFRHSRLRVGTQLIVEIRRPGWIAKYYRFTVRAGHAPRQIISCLAPGATKPGVGC